MATPTLRALRSRFPDARIDATLLPYVCKIVEEAPWFDELIDYDPKGEHKGLAGHARYIRKLRNNRYDLAIVLPNSFSSAMFAFLSGAKRRIGYNRQGRGPLLTDRIAAPTKDGKFVPWPMVEYYLALCKKLGIEGASRKIELFVGAESERRADELFAAYGIGEGRPVVAVNPGAAYGSSKMWASKNFAAACDMLVRRKNCDVILLGGPGEKETAREILQAARANLTNLAEEDIGLDLLKSIIKRCDLAITLDSGPRHFATAFDKPVVVLMGPTDPRYTASNLEKTTIIRIEDLDCSPCHIKNCPTEHECMTRITPEMVYEASVELLDKYREEK
jgi:heptosyltransferase-2